MKRFFLLPFILLCVYIVALGLVIFSAKQRENLFVGALAPELILVMPPGAINSAVTQENIHQTICVSGYTKTIRPPVSYTNALKIKQIKEYGYKNTNPKDYEEDHLISLVLGGSPTSTQNLWPQAYFTVPGARAKDQVEVYLAKQVCAGKMTLKDAQEKISTDWISVYNKIKNNVGGVSQETDQDDF